jgi:hypothetical protein
MLDKGGNNEERKKNNQKKKSRGERIDNMIEKNKMNIEK